MNRLVYLFFLLATAFSSNAQSSFSSANYAASGDTFYITKAQAVNSNYDTTGANLLLNYTALTGVSQRRLVYRLPTQTGYSALQWPYLYNSSNTNLSSTDDQTVAVFGLQQTNPNDYYLRNGSYLVQKASAYTIQLNGISFNVKNTFTLPDTVYKFPFTYNTVKASQAAYTVAVPPDLYYRNVRLERKDTVNGWGTVITPYGTFSNCLKYVSTVRQIDSVSVYGSPFVTNDTSYYKNISWFDPSKGNPILSVKENKIGNTYITQSVEYLDNRQYYQPVALFAYLPVYPNMGDTVSFQNLSTNGYNYKWYFNDPSSGTSDSSLAINPTHLYAIPNTYQVKLIAYNGNLTDTFSLPIVINPVNFTYTFTGNGNWTDPSNWSNNLIPPATLSATNSIVINPVAGGECVFTGFQKILSGSSFTVNANKKLVVQGSLVIQ
jgi:PKD repeat protein